MIRILTSDFKNYEKKDGIKITRPMSNENGLVDQLKNALKRNSYQKAQARKDKLHRLETKYDFSVTENLHGKHFLLIDDVFTTGNTMNAIAWEILKNPSNKISVLVMAIDV